jgi:hypothetical protein
LLIFLSWRKPWPVPLTTAVSQGVAVRDLLVLPTAWVFNSRFPWAFG